MQFVIVLYNCPMITIETKKQEVINKLTNIADQDLLDRIDRLIDDFQAEDTGLGNLAKPMRDTLDIEQLKIEQNYQGFDSTKTDQLIKEIDLQEPLEELLDMI